MDIMSDTSENVEKLEDTASVDDKRKQYISGGLSGLVNLGNTCYMNSALQCLFATDLLLSYFKFGIYKNDLKHGVALSLANKIRKELKMNKNEIVHVKIKDIRKQFKNSITYKLRKLFIVAWSVNCKIKPIIFRSKLCELKPLFRGYEQHDSQEFLNELLDIIHEESKTHVIVEYKDLPKNIEDVVEKCKSFENMYASTNDESEKLLLAKKYDSFKKNNINEYVIMKAINNWTEYIQNNHSIIIDVFTGMYLNDIQCTECNTTSFKFEPFNTITLPIPNKFGDLTLYDCLDNSTIQQTLTDDNKYNCVSCSKKVNAIQKITYWELPNRLIICFKRFDNLLRKNDRTIKFPITNLDMNKYVSNYLNDNNYIYDLYGVVHHSGHTIKGGHYKAYTKNVLNNSWYVFDDANVMHIDTERLESIITNGAYILFYKKRGDMNFTKGFSDDDFDI